MSGDDLKHILDIPWRICRYFRHRVCIPDDTFPGADGHDRTGSRCVHIFGQWLDFTYPEIRDAIRRDCHRNDRCGCSARLLWIQ